VARKSWNTPILWIVAALVLGAGLAEGTRAIFRQLDPFEARSFDRAAWAVADNEGRAAMARDAIRHLPSGLPASDIEPLLGKCERVIETHRLTASGPRGAVRTYSYYLGGWGFPYYDSTFLWVHVGADGRVIEAVIGGG
jgi:hypothetical protein